MLAAVATATQRIGMIATASTTYTEPFNLARQFGSLDHISNGRIGWNIVTSWLATAANNFGGEGQLSHAERYAAPQNGGRYRTNPPVQALADPAESAAGSTDRSPDNRCPCD